MKKIACIALLFLCGTFVFADIAVPFFGGNNFTIDADTTFAADANDGSTGLLTTLGIGLWFEFVPYQDRNITPQRDTVSVSLKLANSAFYAWRGYNVVTDGVAADGSQTPDLYGQQDQAVSIWFDTFIAQLEYNQWFVRIAGIEPEISISQASIRSVFDPVIANRTDIAKNRIPLPLFYAPGNALGGGWSHGNPGITSVINRDIVHLDRREVEIAGNLSAGMKGEIFDFAIKGGSWKVAEENTLNAWVGGGDLSWRPDLSQLISFSFLGAMNYSTVTRKGGFANQDPVSDPLSDPHALEENPFALGLGYEYRINLPRNMAIKPYAGIDFIYEAKSGEYNLEFGGGLQWYFRGSSSMFKRNDKVGGVQIGDVEIPAALIAGMNVDKNGFCNAIISFNEDPRSSPLPNIGGWFQIELMNLSGKTFEAINGQEYSDFLWAGMAQIEYMATSKIMPYVFFKYLPTDRRGKEISDTPVYDKDIVSLTSKLGCRLMPFDYFYVDLWYERTDVRLQKDWYKDNGLISINFGVRNYF
ncbi:MAG: hypothetical protein LBI06_05965 [Treponema sp.]|jgi:hypothetical protein|nr:hypothetical protein [Treponema sp.]